MWFVVSNRHVFAMDFDESCSGQQRFIFNSVRLFLIFDAVVFIKACSNWYRLLAANSSEVNLPIQFMRTLFVCSSRFWMSEIVRPILPWRRWSTETILMPLDRGRFVVVHPCPTFSDCCQLATPLNAEVQKNGKNCFCQQGRQNKPIETKFGT